MDKVISNKNKEYVLVPRASFPGMVFGSMAFKRLEGLGIREWPMFIKIMQDFEDRMGQSALEAANDVEAIYPVLTLETSRKFGLDGKVHTYIKIDGVEYKDPMFEEDDYETSNLADINVDE